MSPAHAYHNASCSFSLSRAAFAALPLPDDDDDDDDVQSSPAANREQRSQARHDTAGDVVVLEWVPYDREAIDERVAHVRRMMHSASSSQPDIVSPLADGVRRLAGRRAHDAVRGAPDPVHPSRTSTAPRPCCAAWATSGPLTSARCWVAKRPLNSSQYKYPYTYIPVPAHQLSSRAPLHLPAGD